MFFLCHHCTIVENPIRGHQNEPPVRKKSKFLSRYILPQILSRVRKYPTPKTIAKAGVDVGKTKANPAHTTGARIAIALGIYSHWLAKGQSHGQ